MGNPYPVATPRSKFELAQSRKHQASTTPSKQEERAFYLRIVARAINNEGRTLEHVGGGAFSGKVCRACLGRVPSPHAATHIVKNAHGAGWGALLCTTCATEIEKLTGKKAERAGFIPGDGCATAGVAVLLPRRA